VTTGSPSTLRTARTSFASLVVGQHASVRVSDGPFDLELVLPEPRAGGPLVDPVMRGCWRRTAPAARNTAYAFLMTFFLADVDDGESFLRSAAFTTADAVVPGGLIVWGDFLAHELFHFWNGQRIRGAEPRTGWRWLAEGFTEYYANVTLAREGLIPADMFLKKAERHLGNYLYFATAPQRPRMSLVEAGTNTTTNRFGVYDGGWSVAFCLDGLIRALRRSRVARRLHARSGRGRRTAPAAGGRPRRAGRRSRRRDPQQFVATAGNGVLPVRDCLARGPGGSVQGYAAKVSLLGSWRPGSAVAQACALRAACGAIAKVTRGTSILISKPPRRGFSTRCSTAWSR
jgi:hypothetical protein